MLGYLLLQLLGCNQKDEGILEEQLERFSSGTNMASLQDKRPRDGVEGGSGTKIHRVVAFV